MTSNDFCFWLQGFLEIGYAEDNTLRLTATQTKMIAEHLALVFKKATPVHKTDFCQPPIAPTPFGFPQCVSTGSEVSDHVKDMNSVLRYTNHASC